MKEYLNLFYGIIDKVHYWDDLDKESKNLLLVNFLDNAANTDYLVKYFDKYKQFLLNNTLNSHIKDVINN